MKKCLVCKIVALLAGLGALNWLLVTLVKFNLVTTILGDLTLASKIAYIAVGIAGILLLVTLFKPCPCAKKAA